MPKQLLAEDRRHPTLASRQDAAVSGSWHRSTSCGSPPTGQGGEIPENEAELCPRSVRTGSSWEVVISPCREEGPGALQEGAAGRAGAAGRVTTATRRGLGCTAGGGRREHGTLTWGSFSVEGAFQLGAGLLHCGVMPPPHPAPSNSQPQPPTPAGSTPPGKPWLWAEKGLE